MEKQRKPVTRQGTVTQKFVLYARASEGMSEQGISWREMALVVLALPKPQAGELVVYSRSWEIPQEEGW